MAASHRDVVVHHAPESIAASEKPSQAIRRAKTTSMGLAINAVKDGQADAAVSGGIPARSWPCPSSRCAPWPASTAPRSRPCLPTLGDQDLRDARPWREHRVRRTEPRPVRGDGSAYARTVLGVAKPRVKLLNIGTEELKGTDELKEAAALLRDADYLALRFDGFTEGDQLSRGNVDVVVTDGFSGNIALKTAEGTARFVTDLLRRAFKSSLRSKAGFALSKPALNLLKVHLDPNNHNGAVFLGLNGLVGEEPRRGQPEGRRQRHQRRRADGAQRHHPEDRRRSRQLPCPCVQRGRAVTVRSVVAGAGSALPKRRVDNEELAKQVDTSDQWIVERTGIRSRYIAGEGETTATLATDAARAALADAGIDGDAKSTSSCSPPPRPTRPSRRPRPRSRRRSASTIASRSTSTRCAPASSMP